MFGHPRTKRVSLLEFKDAFELFDRTGEGIIPFSECAALARCFGFNPLDSHVRVLLGGGDEENACPPAEMMTKSISFEDFLPILWAIANAEEPGTYDEFYEGLKVSAVKEYSHLTENIN